MKNASAPYTSAVQRRPRALATLVAWVSLCAPIADAQAPRIPEVDIQLPASHARYRERIERAAVESLTQYEQWLGPPPAGPLTITTERPHSGIDGRRVVAIDVPWRTSDSMMEVEAQVAFAIAMVYWPQRAGDDVSIARGLSWYLQGRVVERLFNVAYARPGHSSDGLRFFGGYVPWGLPALRLSRWSDARRSDRGAAAFAALERYLGWPVLQGGLKTLAAAAPEARLVRSHVNAAISGAAGQDLTWFFDVAFDPAVRLDYAVTSLVSEPAPDGCAGRGCFHTRVSAARLGDGLFTGSSLPPLGNFDSGGAIHICVAFEDGQHATARWDGRAAERVFEFESPARAVSVRMNPEGDLLLDATPLDHTRYITPQTNVPLGKWVGRWLVWLQDAVLTFTMLV
jgi:hypothetical protein